MEWVHIFTGAGEERLWPWSDTQSIAEGDFGGESGLRVRHGLYTTTAFFPVSRTKTAFSLQRRISKHWFFFLEMKQLPILRYITPFPTLFFCSALYNAFVGRVKQALSSWNTTGENIFCKAQPQTEKSTQAGFFRKEGEHSRGCCCTDWHGLGENASWILQAALLLFHINLKQEGMPKKEV